MSESLLYADICMGYGGATQGAIDAGLVPIFGIDNNSDIVDIAKKNFEHPIIKTDLLAYSKLDFEWLCSGKEKYNAPNWLHASLPCTTATIANKKGESQEDIDLAKAVCKAIKILQPEYFSLENVAGYLKYHSFELIKDCLKKFDYHFDFEVLDCSDYGVPQTRKRLFMVASKDYSTHNWYKRLKPVEKKVSWYDAIADLILTLKPTTLTGWQYSAISHKLGHLPTSLDCPDLVIQRSGARKGKNGYPNNTIRLKDEPMFTIKAMSGKVRVSVKQATIVIDGQAYEADTRCLMRWQTFPDDYQTSGNLILDTKGFGNAVPPLMFSQIIRSVLNGN